jgi:hypothetical protein
MSQVGGQTKVLLHNIKKPLGHAKQIVIQPVDPSEFGLLSYRLLGVIKQAGRVG